MVDESRATLRTTFERAAESYQRARPGYPDELFDDLVGLAELRAGARMLEIGCATGKATVAIAQRGFDVVCVELGAELAQRARANLAGYPVAVEVAPFESWDPGDQRFDLVYAATAWHWIDPAIRYRKAHELLEPGGRLAFWSAGHAFPEGFDPFFTEIQAVYDAIGENHDGEWPPHSPEEMPTDVAEIEDSGLFDDVRVRRYVWEVTYTAEEYIALLETFSGHIAMERNKRERLYGAIEPSLRSGQINRYEGIGSRRFTSHDASLPRLDHVHHASGPCDNTPDCVSVLSPERTFDLSGTSVRPLKGANICVAVQAAAR